MIKLHISSKRYTYIGGAESNEYDEDKELVWGKIYYFIKSASTKNE